MSLPKLPLVFMDGSFFWEVDVTYTDQSGYEESYAVPVSVDAQIGELMAPILEALGKSGRSHHVMEITGSLSEPALLIREVPGSSSATGKD